MFNPRESNKDLDLDDPLFQKYADIAASAQKIVENLLVNIFEMAWHLTGERNFLFSGGVALNSVAVSNLSKCEFLDRLIVPPSPGDLGCDRCSFLRPNEGRCCQIQPEEDKTPLHGVIPRKTRTK